MEPPDKITVSLSYDEIQTFRPVLPESLPLPQKEAVSFPESSTCLLLLSIYRSIDVQWLNLWHKATFDFQIIIVFMCIKAPSFFPDDLRYSYYKVDAFICRIPVFYMRFMLKKHDRLLIFDFLSEKFQKMFCCRRKRQLSFPGKDRGCSQFRRQRYHADSGFFKKWQWPSVVSA